MAFKRYFEQCFKLQCRHAVSGAMTRNDSKKPCVELFKVHCKGMVAHLGHIRTKYEFLFSQANKSLSFFPQVKMFL